MPDVTQFGTIYSQVGALGFMIIVVCLGFGFMVWRIVKAQDTLVEHQRTLSESMAVHVEQAKQIAKDVCDTKITVMEIKGGLK